MTLSEIPDIRPGRLFGCHCYWVGDHIFTGVDSTGWFIRLSTEDRETIKREYGAEHFDPLGGRPMREYIVLPEGVLDDQELVEKWIFSSLEFARSLPTKKK